MAWLAVAALTVGVFVSGLPSEFARLQTPCDSRIVRLAAAPYRENARQFVELGLSARLLRRLLHRSRGRLYRDVFASGRSSSGASRATGWRWWSR